jgi:D-glycero-D-manno-heptose 1,7-bisphosphate phosphatase
LAISPPYYEAVFLDRDGVIIRNRSGYVRSWDDVKFIPGALDALGHLQAISERLIIVTNQSAIGRGLVTLEQADTINRRVTETIAHAGTTIHGLYLCPHAPEEGCPCRKPEPGLILQAIEEHSINPANAAMVGDALTDVEAGIRAGVPINILLRTGRGAVQEQRIPTDETRPSAVLNSLGDVAPYLRNLALESKGPD